MSTPPEDVDVVGQATRLLQTIVGAMTAGLVVFLVVVAFLVPTMDAGKGRELPGIAGMPMFTVLTSAFAAAAIPMSLLMPRLVADSGRKALAARKPADAASDAAGLAQLYTTQKIVGTAINEGAAMFALVGYMLERNSVVLGLALALIGGVAARIPRRDSVEGWMSNQLERLRDERSSV